MKEEENWLDNPTYFKWAAVLIVGLMLSIVFGILLFLVPSFTQVFKQRGVELSLSTKLVLVASMHCTRNWFFVPVGVILAMCLTSTFVKNRSQALPLFIVLFFATALFSAWMIIALYAPMMGK